MTRENDVEVDKLLGSGDNRRCGSESVSDGVSLGQRRLLPGRTTADAKLGPHQGVDRCNSGALHYSPI